MGEERRTAHSFVPLAKPAHGEWTPIENLHIHSKALHRFSSRVWIEPAEIITGEELRGIAGSAIYLPTDDLTPLAEHRPEHVRYGLEGSGYVLMTQNSDDEIDERHLPILNDARLRS